MTLHEGWTALRHGGNLLSPAALDALPDPDAPRWDFADRLRSALVDRGSAVKDAEALGTLLDLVLEEGCGVSDGWEKGSAVGASRGAKLLDGTALKPRRIWQGPDGEALAVFTTPATRIGVGRGRRPAAQVVEYLRRREVPLALLTNGDQWRLVWADPDNVAWVEWEADRWLSADRLADEFIALRHVLSRSSLLREGRDMGALLGGIRDSRRGQARLSKELGERVRRAVESLLRSRAAAIDPVWDEHESKDLYVAASHFIMRLVVILFAEARELLPTGNPVYHQAYGLRGLLDQLDRATPERRRSRHSAWPRLLALFRLLHAGSPHPALTVPRYGGDLFRAGNGEGNGVQRSLALLEGPEHSPDDDQVYRILVLLTRTTQRVREGAGARLVAAPVDFTELTSEYIGILYEGLLDYELHRAGSEPVVFLNLGDQPALPLDRLEQMEDRALAALVEKAKVRRGVATGENDAEDGEEEEEGDEASDSEEIDTDEEVEEEPAVAVEDEAEEDQRVEARARATAWGRRAVEVGRLVRRPRSRNAAALAAYEAELDAAAGRLVADLKLPGELYLVRWGGTRKGAGTFYTRPQLTLPTVRRTLAPLLREEEGTQRLRPPEALLSLKICDPAMGSGSFPVAALRVLTEAVIASLHQHGRIERVNGRTTVECALIPEADRTLPTEGFEERLEAIVRRAVVEHCLYGVDRDPLAVELARVALWVETLDRTLPFTFLDHKLRCGDSLVGTWLDRFRDYPLLSLSRESPDHKFKGVHHEGDVWHKALREARLRAIEQQVEILRQQLRLEAPALSDEELKEAVERARRSYRELHEVPAGRPDERARIWRDRIQADESLGRVREAFDSWCALWFWPLDRLELLPLPQELHAPSEAARKVVREVAERHRFFHWELEFPDVFTGEGAGFDAVVGNPPWETLQPQSKEFFTNHDPLYSAYGKQEGLGVQKVLFAANAQTEAEWLDYVGGFKNVSNWLKHAAEPFGDGRVSGHGGGDVTLVRGNAGAQLHKAWETDRARHKGHCDPAHPFREQGGGKAYTYKMFLEVGHALLRKGGQLGFLVPSGLYTDKGSGALRKLLLEGCRWRWIYGFENRNKVFDIHRSFKFCVLLAEKGGRTESIRVAFMRHDLEDWAETRGALDYPAERVTAFSPKSLSILEIRSKRDLEVLTRIYENSVLLGEEGPGGWGIRYAQGDFNMTSDSKLFITRDKAEADGFRPDIYGRWVNEEGEVLLPLYQGAMIGQFDPCFKAWAPGSSGAMGWNRSDSWPVMRPKYLVPVDVYNRSPKSVRDPRLAFRDVARGTDQRTMISTLIPPFPAGNKVPYLVFSKAGLEVQCASVLNSFCFDWEQRVRQGATSLNWYLVQEGPLPALDVTVPQLDKLVLRLAAIGEVNAFRPWPGHGPAWRKLWAITPHERLRFRCMLDAIVTMLYGLNRGDFAWILKDCDHPRGSLSEKAFCRRLDAKGFWRVDKERDPELRHTVLSLAAFDDLDEFIRREGERDTGIRAFCDQNDGDGWMLPETLCLADLALTRTADVADYDDRARVPQPVRSRMGARFLDWQLKQTPEESWAECEYHARVLSEGVAAEPVPRLKVAEPAQPWLFDEDA